MKLKVCGMKYYDNIKQVAALQPDYLGFIFYEKSSRFMDADIPELPQGIIKVGVFVNASIENVITKVNHFGLGSVQLHGQESAEYCHILKQNTGVKVIKVFSILDDFDFSVLDPYEDVCDFYLFDTKGELPGGNGYTFNWEVLKLYPSQKPYFLSGGIGSNEVEKIKHFKEIEASKYCYAIDVNSKFELQPGLKNNIELEKFKNEL